MKNWLLILGLSCVAIYANAQQTHIVFLKDKNVHQQPVDLTDRAIARRMKNSVHTDDYDLPINPNYLSELSEYGRIIQTSRWLNAVRFETEISSEELAEKCSFIDRIQSINPNEKSTLSDEKWKIESHAKALNYGWADTQIRQINLPCLHNDGYTGGNVYLAILDAGFNGMDTISYFDSVYLENRILDQFDYVGGGSVYNYSGHGTAVASCIVAEKTGTNAYIGAAPDVDLALFVTEDVSSETQLEEFNLVAALERCDSIGVEVVNISLGYLDFDDSTTNYTYADLDGQTTISAIGARVAASKGIIVVTSAGNGGPGKISTPCDADSILCVGAIDGFENWAWFSSVGPSYDNRVKPDVVARGGGPWVVYQDGFLGQSNGTSFSSPITAGATACLVQANPTKTAQEIIQSIRESASQFSAPDTLLGYGIPNFCSPFAGLVPVNAGTVSIFPNPAKDQITITGVGSEYANYLLVNELGEVILKGSVHSIDGGMHVNIAGIANGWYVLKIQSSEAYFLEKVIIQH